MTDPDTEHTPRDFGDVLDENDYSVAKRAKQAKRYEDTCDRDIDYFYGVKTACGRPSGHDGDCHPVPLARDKEDSDGEE